MTRSPRAPLSRRRTAAALRILALLVVTRFALAPAVAGAADPPAAKKDAASQDLFKIGGLYTIWGLNQRRFLLGKDHQLDDADYVVQMLRFNMQAGTPKFGVIARFDAAQGWWGANNSPNVVSDSTLAADGTLTNAPTYNPYSLFRNKDTNYDVHFDHAYLYLEVPLLPIPVRVQAGRQYFGVGNKLVLDQDMDGVIVQATPHEMVKLEFMWAKVSEGKGAFKIPSGLLMSDDDQFGDANLLGGKVWVLLDKIKAEFFGLYYWDSSDASDWTYLPNGVGYLRSRFAPNLSKVFAGGVSLSGSLAVLDGLSFTLEWDGLIGKDEIANTSFNGGMNDINNGDLIGTNFYANAIQKINVGVPLDVGLIFGIGSGDKNQRGGKGNINKIQTMGFFPLTNVWEDSVMPDINGISPQGLGSPVSRGYRELENTIALQLKLGARLLDPLRLEASYTYLRATRPVRGWDATGPSSDPDRSSHELGHEIDANLILNIYGERVIYKALFGAFLPGNAAGFLINGNLDALDTAIEVKQVIVVKF